MGKMENSPVLQQDNDSLKRMRRALFYEAQFRNAILSDALSFYDVNLTRDLIENDFFFRDSENDFVSVPDFIGITTPCSFTSFLQTWTEAMIPDPNQKSLQDFSRLREKLLEIFNEGKREYVVNYWAESVNGKKVFFNQRFLLTKNEMDEVCALVILKDYTKVHELDDDYLQTELEMFAYSDPITKGYNYIKFKEKLKEKAIAGSIICLDIHSFKVINSICGVTKGDDVIRVIWERLLIALDFDKNELAAHINADHYVIFLPTTDSKEIVRKLKNISLNFLVISSELDIPVLQPYFGISKWAPGKKIEMAYSEAITAKHNAKNQQNIDYAFFDEEDTNRLIKEKAMLDSFDEALARKEFKIWFQPKYTPKTKHLVGAEALVRWIKDDGTMYNPGEFIPLFERNNVIRKLDVYIFRNVCLQQKRWLDKGKKIVPVSVNLSRASLYFNGVADEYKKIAELMGIEPKMIPIEITESAAITNTTVKEVIDDFHRVGFSLQMDDFGTGYSSLASLNLLHFDTLKLDKSLIDYIGEFGGNRLLEHTITLAKELGMQITAEGVETEAQVTFLKNTGCDNIQGFFYSKPVPAENFSNILDKEIFDGETSKNELIEEHIFGFNHNYYKLANHSFTVNLTKNKVPDYFDHEEWINKTSVKTDIYSDIINELAQKFVHPDYMDTFLKAMDREQILKDFTGLNQTKIIEYKQIFDGKMINMKNVINVFKVADSDDVWLYIKIFTLD